MVQPAQAEGRGGILTMPGILAMNRGPVLRGAWMLRKILGERLGDPPADVPPIEAAAPNAELTFRERFEQHRSDPTCARCHDRIDPLGCKAVPKQQRRGFTRRPD